MLIQDKFNFSQTKVHMFSSPETQSDYTPKDFLAKLLSKPPSVQSNTNDGPYNSQITTYSQTQVKLIQISKFNKTQSPKNIRRIHLQSVGNIQTISKDEQKQNGSLQFIDQKRQSETKEPMRRIVYIKSPQNKSSKSTNPQINSQTSIRQKIQSTEKSKISAHHENLLQENELIIKKTQFFLKSALKQKINEEQIEDILKSLKKGFQTPFQFDRIIQQININNNSNHKRVSLGLQVPILNKRAKSISWIQQIKKKEGQKRYSSLKKSILVRKQKTRKQFKKQTKQSRAKMLKQIKKLKQMVFLNEKSLRLTRKISMK